MQLLRNEEKAIAQLVRSLNDVLPKVVVLLESDSVLAPLVGGWEGSVATKLAVLSALDTASFRTLGAWYSVSFLEQMKSKPSASELSAAEVLTLVRTVYPSIMKCLTATTKARKASDLSWLLSQLLGDFMILENGLYYCFPHLEPRDEETSAEDEEQAKRDGDAVLASIEMRRRLSLKD